MIILGLGTSDGDRLKNLRNAVAALRHDDEIRVRRVSPIYQSDALLPPEAEAEWNKPYLNAAVAIETKLLPLGLLRKLKGIEGKLGRKPAARWAPRVIDIDILVWNDLVYDQDNLKIPHEGLLERPFALWPIDDLDPSWAWPYADEHQGKPVCELAQRWPSRFTGEAPLQTKQVPFRVEPPAIVGILNATPDSFSDGGLYNTVETAVQQAVRMATAGAEVIDIGAESTRPGAEVLTLEQEWERLEPILLAVKEATKNLAIAPKISIDTRNYQTAVNAVRCGIDWLNDPSGLSDERMRDFMKGMDTDIVIMHHLTIPADPAVTMPRVNDPATWIYEAAQRRIDELTGAGIARDRLIYDPGIGFGKTADQSLALVRSIKRLTELSTRVLLGHSRKSFFKLISGATGAKLDIETMAVSYHAGLAGVDYVRVHNAEATARVLSVASRLGSA